MNVLFLLIRIEGFTQDKWVKLKLMFSLFFYGSKQGLRVLVRTATMNIYNLCFRTKITKTMLTTVKPTFPLNPFILSELSYSY